MSTQIAVRLSDEELAALDWIVVHCHWDSRAEALRTALAELTERLRSEEIDRAIIDGYTRIPETQEELDEAMRLSIESIREEPWERWW
ncbi:MAG: hypothetical protein ACR2HP_16150 [Ilumatobacteraceae bacterium]